MKVIESTSDPRSEYYDLMRRENLPADELMGRRMETGVLAVLAQLRAQRNWHRIIARVDLRGAAGHGAGRARVGVLRPSAASGARRDLQAGPRACLPARQALDAHPAG